MHIRTFSALFCLLASSVASAATVQNVTFNAESDEIEVTVRHGGGCGRHTYELEFGSCLESLPASITAKVIHHDLDQDRCEALISRTFKVPASQMSACRPAHLVVRGDRNSQATAFIPAAAAAAVRPLVPFGKKGTTLFQCNQPRTQAESAFCELLLEEAFEDCSEAAGQAVVAFHGSMLPRSYQTEVSIVRVEESQADAAYTVFFQDLSSHLERVEGPLTVYVSTRGPQCEAVALELPFRM